MIKEIRIDSLTAFVYASRKEMGAAVVRDVTAMILKLLQQKECINILFAAAPSQDELLEGLAGSEEIPWERIRAFHMDEYLGLDENAPQGFGNFLNRSLFSRVPLNEVFFLGRSGGSAEEECEYYSHLLRDYPLDIALLGIGENGHLAFNDPPVADFNDKADVKAVTLDQTCRQQQVNDGCFTSLEAVPETALTLTIPQLIKAEALFCTVPGERKEDAVTAALKGEIAESCPASILRTVKSRLYLDKASGAGFL